MMTTTPHPSAESSLSHLATTFAGASRVFHRHRLDFCCNGGRSLAVVAQQRGLDVTRLLAEIEAESLAIRDHVDWHQAPLGALIDHLESAFHAPHRAELPRLQAMAAKVERVHAAKPGCPVGLAAHLQEMTASLEQHMLKEEMVLFPAVRSGLQALPRGACRTLELEHDDHAADLRRTREIASDLVPPVDACTTWRALYLGLAQFERDVMDHVHLENHVLFPRVLQALDGDR